MLLRPLIAFVVFTINIGNTSAILKRREKLPVSLNNVPYNQPPTAPVAAAIGQPLQNVPLANSPRLNNFDPLKLRPTQNLVPPLENPHFKGAKCGRATHNIEDIINARAKGCANLPSKGNKAGTRPAVQYNPALPRKYKGTPPYYLFPIGKPLLQTKNTRYYGFDRILLDRSCQAVAVLTEVPKVDDFPKKKKIVVGRPLQNYDQNKYKYVDCTLF